MKIKKLLMPLLFLISCLFAFSACSNVTAKFNFGENNTVKLTYTCADEEKNFVAELNSEQSRNFIFLLNKITFSEVKEHLEFGPSYDRLRITVGNDKVDLYDVWSMINNGGYLYFNGRFCHSKEKFSFLEPYMVEYCSNVISSSIPFEVQYVKQTVGAKDNCKIIKSVSQLNEYIANETQNRYLPDFELFKDEVVNKYNDEYFENSFLVLFMKEATSGSFGFRVNDVSISGNSLTISYEIILPEGYGEGVAVTCDMAYWYSFVELSNEYGAISNVDLISSK